MQGWQTTDLDMRELPRDITGFELRAFFTFSPAERTLSTPAAATPTGSAWPCRSDSCA